VDLYVANGNGRKECRRVLLDTGASVNVMAKDVQRDTGYEMEPCDGLIKPFEAKPIKPLGIVRGVQWNFTDGAKTFVEDFFVIDTDEFDTLLGKYCLERNGILRFSTGEDHARFRVR
jgi:hypothetical protein